MITKYEKEKYFKKQEIKNKTGNRTKNIFIFIASVAIIIFLIFLAVRDNFNIKNILLDIEKQTDLSIELNKESSLTIYPKISFYNPDVTIKNTRNLFYIKKGNILINKSYWPSSPFKIKLNSNLINFHGIELRNTDINANYKNKKIIVNKLISNLIEGKIEVSGNINLESEIPFIISGFFKNISLNTLFKKSDIASWDRLKIKLSSKKLNIAGLAENKEKFINSLKGDVEIIGSIYLTATQEELFGAALLSLLVEKSPNISSISDSINFILSTYANIPTSLSGKLNIKDGIISTKNIIIQNEIGQSSLNGLLDLKNNTIDGTIYFYKDNKIFIEAMLKGNIAKPQILVGGDVFEQDEVGVPRDIKKIFEDGINSLVDKLLQINE